MADYEDSNCEGTITDGLGVPTGRCMIEYNKLGEIVGSTMYTCDGGGAIRRRCYFDVFLNNVIYDYGYRCWIFKILLRLGVFQFIQGHCVRHGLRLLR